MMPLTRSLTLTAALLSAWLMNSGFAHAAAPQVNDEGKFFSPAAIEKANQKIHDIYRDYGKDLLIETVSGIPSELQDRYKALGKRKFFVDWAVKRAEESGCKGIYVLLCKSPGYLQIEVGQATRQRGFTLQDRERLFHQMRPLLDKKDRKNNDEALMLAVDTVDSTLRANLGKQPPANDKHGGAGTVSRSAKPNGAAPASRGGARAPESGESPSLWTWVLIGVGVIVVVWLLMALLRAMSGGGAGAGGYGGPGGYGGGGGGGFFSSLLAGMFGAAAGAWLYDSFFHSGSSGHAFGASPSDQISPLGNEPSDSDYSGDDGGGGGFGDDAGDDNGGGGFGGDDAGGGDFGGGADFGGGDFGGGDFGGGDSGGGDF